MFELRYSNRAVSNFYGSHNIQSSVANYKDLTEGSYVLCQFISDTNVA